MKAKQIFKNILFWGALYYTVITALLIVINLLMRGDSAQVVIDPTQFLLVLLFSYIAAGCSRIAAIDTLPRSLGVLISAVGHIGGFFLCLVLPSNTGFTGSVIITLLFAIAYAIVAVTVALVKKRNGTAPQSNATKKKSPSEKRTQEYKSMFGGDKK